MRCEMTQPCMASRESALRMSMSNVPWRTSALFVDTAAPVVCLQENASALVECQGERIPAIRESRIAAERAGELLAPRTRRSIVPFVRRVSVRSECLPPTPASTLRGYADGADETDRADPVL